MALPETLFFEDVTRPGGTQAGQRCYYRRVRHAAPKKGEWFVSGAIPQAYRAKNDLMRTEYLIVVPTFFANPTKGYTKGPAVPQTQGA